MLSKLIASNNTSEGRIPFPMSGNTSGLRIKLCLSDEFFEIGLALATIQLSIVVDKYWYLS